MQALQIGLFKNMDLTSTIKKSITLKQHLLEDKKLLNNITLVINKVTSCFQENGQVLFCGNGGSAADAQHLAAELSGKFYMDRKPLNAEALHVNSSYITAVSNDFSFDEAYARNIEAKGKKGDILIAISTSGNSKNIVNALQRAKKIGLTTIGLTGKSGGELNELCDITLKIPSTDTPRIQECHILIGHIICEEVEKALFKS